MAINRIFDKHINNFDSKQQIGVPNSVIATKSSDIEVIYHNLDAFCLNIDVIPFGTEVQNEIFHVRR